MTPVKPGYIYFVQKADDATAPIKIGYTRGTPIDRRTNIAANLPWPLKLLAAFLCDEPELEEMAAKQRLASHRIRGEWFEADAAAREMQNMTARFPLYAAKPPKVREAKKDRCRLIIPIPQALKNRLRRLAYKNQQTVNGLVNNLLEDTIRKLRREKRAARSSRR